MLAGGMVIAAPSMVPEAAASGALFVSAENAEKINLFFFIIYFYFLIYILFTSGKRIESRML
jgi:hypothetical protein